MTVGTPEQSRVGGGDGFCVSFRQLGSACVLELEGALRSSALAALESEFDRLWRTPCRRVVLDLNDLCSIDEAGARVLTGLHHYVHARGGTLTLVGLRPWLVDALDGTPLLAAHVGAN